MRNFAAWLEELHQPSVRAPDDAALRKLAETIGTGHGWKIHLTTGFNDEDRSKAAKAVEWIRTRSRIPFDFKVLGGGEAGEKDITIYVGPKNKAMEVAGWIRQNTILKSVLKDAAPGVKNDDIELIPGVWARFDTAGKDARFSKYGNAGWDLLEDDKRAMAMARWGNAYDPKAARDRAYKALVTIYGKAFTGQ